MFDRIGNTINVKSPVNTTVVVALYITTTTARAFRAGYKPRSAIIAVFATPTAKIRNTP